MTEDDKYPSQLAERFQIRMPDGLRDRLRIEAEKNHRSMNAEIVRRLQWSIDEDQAIESANRHLRMLERVNDGDIDPEDVPDGPDAISIERLRYAYGLDEASMRKAAEEYIAALGEEAAEAIAKKVAERLKKGA